MKISVLYFSKTGCTEEMAADIVKGMRSIEGVEAKAMPFSKIDGDFVKESKCIVIGTPTYYTSMAGEVKSWLDTEAGNYDLNGKLGGAFATANHIQGGGCIAIQNILIHLIFRGMLVYSGGGACGKPPIHMGPVALFNERQSQKAIFEMYGKRMAAKAQEIFK